MRDSDIKTAEAPAGAQVQYETVSAHRILVIDDNNYMRKFCVDVLTDSGFEVNAVADGAAGWEELQFNNYDLIITDNIMPKMTGIEMLEKMRFARMSVPVIMVTGYLPTQVFAHKPWLKPDAMLERPFSSNDLLQTVKDVLM